jgi:hypothetical protein
MLTNKEAVEQWYGYSTMLVPETDEPVTIVMMAALDEALHREFAESDDPMETAKFMQRFWIAVNASDKVKKAVKDSGASFMQRFEAMHVAEYAYINGYSATLEHFGECYRTYTPVPDVRSIRSRKSA